MLVELRVRNLGVVRDATLLLEEGMTALTGETGAGKTMVVEAIRLLSGGRADQHMVRTGAQEAIIEGRFHDDSGEIVLTRSIRKDGRSRCSINGEMATVSAISEIGGALVDLHGQHSHQTLMHTAAQRDALDSFGNINTSKLASLHSDIRDVEEKLSSMGGDVHARAREIDLLEYQLTELDNAEIQTDDEDAQLLQESERLNETADVRTALDRVGELLSDDIGMRGLITDALRLCTDVAALKNVAQKLNDIGIQLDDVIHDAGGLAAEFEDNPERLEWLQQRRALLKQLMRKYGTDLAQVINYREQTRQRLEELKSHDEVVAQLESQRRDLQKAFDKESTRVRQARTEVAPKLAKCVEKRLHDLALPNARFNIAVGTEGAGDNVVFELGPNPGMPLLPVAKAASGGELARTMLALRLALLESSAKFEQHPPTLIFDEVDAGIGGEAALLVGKALAELSHGTNNQVFVVTHLPQVAAFADHQVSVRKEQELEKTSSEVIELSAKEREIELARMLSGRPDSSSGRAHARELLKASGNLK